MFPLVCVCLNRVGSSWSSIAMIGTKRTMLSTLVFFQTRRLRESEERYERRESLPEDLDAIAQLKELVRERESQIHKLVVSNVVCVVQFVNERNEIDRRQTTKTVQVMSSDNPSCCSQCFTTAFYQDVVFFELTESELKHVYPEARHLRDCVSAQSCL